MLRTNKLILADSTSDMFVTAYYGVLDAVRHKLTYASAGHNLALHAPAGGCASEPMVTSGIALGIIAEAEIEEKSLELGARRCHPLLHRRRHRDPESRR